MNRQQRIAELKAELAKLEKVAPEKRFLELMDRMTIRIYHDKYPDSVFFFKDDKWMVEIVKSIAWFRYSGFWDVFEGEFSMQSNDVQQFLRDMLKKHFKMKGLTPHGKVVGSKRG